MAPLPPLVTSALIGAGASTLSNIFTNVANRNATDVSFSRQKELIALQNSYNAPINQMYRLKEAGLNPNLVYAGSNAVMPGASPSSVATPSYRSPLDSSAILDVFNAAKVTPEAKVLETQAEKNSKESDVLEQQEQNLMQDTILKMKQAGLTDEQINTQVSIQQLNASLRDYQDDLGTIAWQRLSIDKGVSDSVIKLNNMNAFYLYGMLQNDNVRVALQQMVTPSQINLNNSQAYQAREIGDFNHEQADFLKQVKDVRLAREQLQNELMNIQKYIDANRGKISTAEAKYWENITSDYRLALDNVNATIDVVDNAVSTVGNVVNIVKSFTPLGAVIPNNPTPVSKVSNFSPVPLKGTYPRSYSSKPNNSNVF